MLGHIYNVTQVRVNLLFPNLFGFIDPLGVWGFGAVFVKFKLTYTE